MGAVKTLYQCMKTCFSCIYVCFVHFFVFCLPRGVCGLVLDLPLMSYVECIVRRMRGREGALLSASRSLRVSIAREDTP